MKKVREFLKNEDGATAIEYGLIAALVGVAIIVSVNNVGTATESMYDDVTTTIDNATNP